MKWEQRSIVARTFQLIKSCSFEKNLELVLARADIRTVAGRDRTVTRMDGLVMEQGWVSKYMEALR
jgi:hypothetical protein